MLYKTITDRRSIPADPVQKSALPSPSMTNGNVSRSRSVPPFVSTPSVWTNKSHSPSASLVRSPVGTIIGSTVYTMTMTATLQEIVRPGIHRRAPSTSRE